MNTKGKPTLIDLFAGCGGLSLGLENAGFHSIYVNELNNDALDTYLINREDNPLLRSKFSTNDIKDVIKNDPKLDQLINDLNKSYSRDFTKDNIDLVAGGPPCQGYSGIGIRRSYSVDKEKLPSNHLYDYMGYFIEKIKPKIFLFENVEGLLNSRWNKDGIKGDGPLEVWH